MPYNEDVERESWSFLTGVMLGTALGATVALLLAPKRGQELRGDLATAAAGVRDAAVTARDKVSSQVSNLRKTAADMAERGSAMASDASRAIQDTAQSVTESGAAMFDTSRRAAKRVGSTGSAD